MHHQLNVDEVATKKIWNPNAWYVLSTLNHQHWEFVGSWALNLCQHRNLFMIWIYFIVSWCRIYIMFLFCDYKGTLDECISNLHKVVQKLMCGNINLWEHQIWSHLVCWQKKGEIVGNLSHMIVGVVWDVSKILRFLPRPFVYILEVWKNLLHFERFSSLRCLLESSNSKLLTLNIGGWCSNKKIVFHVLEAWFSNISCICICSIEGIVFLLSWS